MFLLIQKIKSIAGERSYNLAGYSFGAIVAYEITQQDNNVASLVCIDGSPAFFKAVYYKEETVPSSLRVGLDSETVLDAMFLVDYARWYIGKSEVPDEVVCFDLLIHLPMLKW